MQDHAHTETIPAPPVPAAGWFSDDRRPLTTMVVTNFLSLFSNNLTGIAVPWFVLTLTGSATQTGITAAATLLPAVVMSFFGGAMVDRTSARRMSIFSDVMSGATVAFVPLLYMLDVLSFPLLLLLMFLGSVFDSPGHTARNTMLPRLAERAQVPLERVNAALGVNQSLTGLVGAVIAGVLVGTLGAANVLWINAAAFAVSALAMVLFVPELGVHPQSGATLMEDIREGMTWLWRQSALRTIVLAAVVLNAVFTPMGAVALPYLAKMEYDSAAALGLIMSGFGGGGLIGALAYGWIGTRIPRRVQALVAVALTTLPVLGMVTIPPLWVTWFLQFLIGIGVGAVNPMVATFLQTMTPPAMLGRVSGVFMASAMVAAPAGVLLGGPLIAAAGLSGAFLTFGLVLAAVLLTLLGTRSLASLDDVTASR